MGLSPSTLPPLEIDDGCDPDKHKENPEPTKKDEETTKKGDDPEDKDTTTKKGEDGDNDDEDFHGDDQSTKKKDDNYPDDKDKTTKKGEDDKGESTKKKDDDNEDDKKKIHGRYPVQIIEEKCKGKRDWCKEYINCVYKANEDELIGIFPEVKDTERVILSEKQKKELEDTCKKNNANEVSCEKSENNMKRGVLVDQLTERLIKGSERSGRMEGDSDSSGPIIACAIAAVLILLVCVIGYFFCKGRKKSSMRKGKSIRSGKKSSRKMSGRKNGLRSKGSRKSGRKSSSGHGSSRKSGRKSTSGVGKSSKSRAKSSVKSSKSKQKSSKK